MADIRINDLPAEASPVASEAVAIDGATTRRTTIQKLVDAGSPIASQAEAEAGTNPTKRMTPLTTKQFLSAETGASVQAYSANLDLLAGTSLGSTGITLLEAATSEAGRMAIELEFIANVSMVAALNAPVLEIRTTGSDTVPVEDYATYGTPGSGTAFLTWQAALLHAKNYIKFKGQLNVVMLAFDNGAKRSINLGSNKEQAQERYPFSIGITSIDTATKANWAKFDSLTCGTFHGHVMFFEKVYYSYCAVTRNGNIMWSNDCRIHARRDVDNNVISHTHIWYSSLNSSLHLFGDHEITETMTCTSSALYVQQGGNLRLENGDSPVIFPMLNLINPLNIVSPTKYRCVGAHLYAPGPGGTGNIYQQLTYATNWYCDANGFTSQTMTGEELQYNIAAGGPIVLRSGSPTSGYELRADGHCRMWGTETLTSLATGRTNAAAAVTFPKTLASSTYLAKVGSNNVNLHLGQHGSPATTGFTMGAYNMDPSAQSATARWELTGYLG